MIHSESPWNDGTSQKRDASEHARRLLLAEDETIGSIEMSSTGTRQDAMQVIRKPLFLARCAVSLVNNPAVEPSFWYSIDSAKDSVNFLSCALGGRDSTGLNGAKCQESLKSYSYVPWCVMASCQGRGTECWKSGTRAPGATMNHERHHHGTE